MPYGAKFDFIKLNFVNAKLNVVLRQRIGSATQFLYRTDSDFVGADIIRPFLISIKIVGEGLCALPFVLIVVKLRKAYSKEITFITTTFIFRMFTVA